MATNKQHREKQIQKQAIRRLVKRNIRKKPVRNSVLALTVMLVTMLMTVLFGAGISLYENAETATDRARGTLANGGLYMATEQEAQQIEGIDEVSAVGRQHFVAEITGIPDMPARTSAVMTAYDDTEWEQFIRPTVGKITGAYPEKEDEVMASEWVLEKLGITKARVGMELPLTFTTLTGETLQKTFTLSGYYKDYIYAEGSAPNSGNTMSSNLYYDAAGSSVRAAGNVVVSDAFAERYGTEKGKYVSFYIDDRLSAAEAFDLLNNATGNNNIFIAGFIKSWQQSLSAAMLPILLVLLVMVGGYLLIYNIVNISVLQEMHMYGQLKTLGADTRQLKRIVRCQVNLVTVIGIPLGLIAGWIFAVLTVPYLLGAFTEGSGWGDKFDTRVVISPLIFLFAVVFAYLTVRFSCRKSMKMAAKVSPVEALKYVERTDKVKGHRTSGGGKPRRMAYRNVFRSRRRALVTMLSLFFGFVIYLAVSASTERMDYGLKFDREQPHAFSLINLSFGTGENESVEDVLDAGKISQIGQIDGVTDILVAYQEFAEFEYTDADKEWLEPYIEEQAKYEERTKEEIEQEFHAAGVGLQVEKFADYTYESTLPWEEILTHLEDGTGIFLTDTGADNSAEVSGRIIRIKDRAKDGKTAEYTVLGILTLDRYEETGLDEADWRTYGENGIADTYFYTSTAGLERLTGSLRARKIDIDTVSSESGENEQGDLSGDRKIKETLDELFAGSDGVQIDSQVSTREAVSGLISVIQMIGAVIAGFLVFLGMINFVNVIFTSIYSRQKELAALESMGMTKRQIRITLVLEGVYYSMITALLLATAGMAVSYLGYLLVRGGFIYFAGYTAPVIQLAVIVAGMLLVCAVVPILVYKNIAKESVVERLRKGQD